MTTRARNVLRNYVNMDESLDAVLEKCLAVCGGRSPHDAVVVALHACLLSEGFVCIATGDEVGDGLQLEYLAQQSCELRKSWEARKLCLCLPECILRIQRLCTHIF